MSKTRLKRDFDDNTRRLCCTCKTIKPLESHYHKSKNRPLGYEIRCKQCSQKAKAESRSKMTDEQKKASREKIKQWHDADKMRNPEKYKLLNRKWALKRDFNMSLEDYNTLLEKQDGVCAICGKTDPVSNLAVDHCHVTNKVRGLLCRACNRGIGMLQDSIELLEKSVIYLKENNK